MKVELRLEGDDRYCAVRREEGDKKIYKESLFFYFVACQLKIQGHDVVKKLMWKDGHLVDDNQYYIRQRKWQWAVFDNLHAVRFAYEDYNRDGKTELRIVTWEEK